MYWPTRECVYFVLSVLFCSKYLDVFYRIYHGTMKYMSCADDENLTEKRYFDLTRTAMRSCRTWKRAFHFYLPGVVDASTLRRGRAGTVVRPAAAAAVLLLRMLH